MVSAETYHIRLADAMFNSCEKSISRKQSQFFHRIISVFCTTHQNDNVTVNLTLLALKVVAVAWEKCLLTRGSQCSDLTAKLLVFSEKWSLRRGGRNRMFHCTYTFIGLNDVLDQANLF